MSPLPDAVETYCPRCGRVFTLSQEYLVCPDDNCALLPRTEDPMINRVVEGKFRIQGVIGRGGYSTVYRAEHIPLNRTVAFKLLRSDLASNANRKQRFEREAKLASSLNHPNICRVYDCGVLDSGQPFLVMEFVEGKTVGHVLAEGVLRTECALSIIKQIAAGLKAAHDKGIVHRDLKPENVMLVNTSDGEIAKIIDFGVAKLFEGQEEEHVTAGSALLGTPFYMSPEQIRGDMIDARSDIYSLGCVMYEMFTGNRPFVAQTPFETMQRHLRDKPPPMAVGNQLVAFPLREITLKCLPKNPDERYQSIAEVQTALDALDCTSLVPESSIASTQQGSWVKPLAGAVAVVACLALVTCFTLQPAGKVDQTTPARTTTQEFDPTVSKMLEEFKTLKQSGHPETAERVGKRAFEYLEKSGREHSPDMVLVCKELQSYYAGTFRKSEAVPYVVRMFEAEEKLAGGDSDRLLQAHRDAAKGFIDAGHYKMGIDHSQKVLDLLQKDNRTNSILYAEALHQLASMELRSGADQKGEEHYGKLLKLLDGTSDAKDLQLTATSELCQFYIDHKQAKKAKQLADRSISLLSAETPLQRKAEIYRLAAHASEVGGDNMAAVNYMNSALATIRAMPMEGNRTFLLTEFLGEQGEYLLATKQYGAAKIALKDAMKLWPPHTNEFKYALGCYIKVLRATGRNREAAAVERNGRP